MSSLLRVTVISRRRSRSALCACLVYAQALAPDWPLLAILPFFKTSFRSAIARFSNRKPRRSAALLSPSASKHSCAS